MPDFISKIQHKTYEKGEFSEEKVRTLAETIELIKTFPWDQERTLTSVKLTGPSVTIRDEDINWLKVGLYFNGKFCLYYLDNNNHLYEYRAPTMDDACTIVTNFFNQKLELQKFEKHFINIGNQAHFETKYFEYRVKLWRVLMLMSLMLFYSVLIFPVNFVVLTKGISPVDSIGSKLLVVFFPIVSLFFCIVLFLIIRFAFSNRNNYLQLSKGNPIFYFGHDENSIQTYHKTDIKEVLFYSSHSSRSPNFISFFEICFHDGSSIKLSNMLIPEIAFQSKFPENLVKRGKKSLFRLL